MAYAPVQGTTGSRNILDRNPVSKNVDFIANNVGPHGSTIRGTYTTPANKLAQVDLITGFIIRRTADSAVDFVTVKITASIAGRLLTLQFKDNTVGFIINCTKIFNSPSFSCRNSIQLFLCVLVFFMDHFIY